MAVDYIEYKGKKILHIDYSGAKDQKDMIEILYKAVAEFRKADKRLRSLNNMTNAFMGLEYMQELKKVTPTELMPKAHKSAVYGIDNLKSILIKGYNATVGNADIVTFQTKEEALDYLVS